MQGWGAQTFCIIFSLIVFIFLSVFFAYLPFLILYVTLRCWLVFSFYLSDTRIVPQKCKATGALLGWESDEAPPQQGLQPFELVTEFIARSCPDISCFCPLTRLVSLITVCALCCLNQIL